MKPVAKRSSAHLCAIHGLRADGVTPGASQVLVNGEPISVLADMLSCSSAISEGANLVLAGQLPVVHLGHASLHGGVATAALSPDVFVGGPTFSLPANFAIEGSPAFQNKTLRDLFFLSQTKNGRAVIDRLAASGQKVTFRDYQDRPPPPPGEKWPKTSFTVPDPLDASPDVPNDVVIYYEADPENRAVWSEEPYVSTSTSPQVNLFHEMVHGMHVAEGDALPPDQVIPGTGDPAMEVPPYQEEEARTVGDGSEGWGDEEISENTLRDELGMPRRRDILTPTSVQENHVAGPTDHRPGEDP